MAVPLVFSALALVGALLALLKLDEGRPATGERVTLHVKTACAPPTGAVMLRRAAAVGLGDPVLVEAPDGLALTVTLPGLDDDRATIPALLTAPGKLEVRAAGRTVATEDDVSGTALNMDASGSPYAEIAMNGLALTELREATKDGGRFTVLLDGATLLDATFDAVRDEKLRLTPDRSTPGAQMRAVADWTILLSSGALPCPVTAMTLAAPSAEG